VSYGGGQWTANQWTANQWTANQWNYNEAPGGPSGAWNNDGAC
jgi:chitinase